MRLAKVRAYLEDDLARVDKIILKQLESDVPLITEVNKHIYHGGGKRIRPILVLLGAKAFHYEAESHLLLAAAIELIHTATLLHDDVVDNSTMRRGLDTANKIWGNQMSVLVGDYLYSRAVQLMVKTNNMQTTAVIADAANTLAAGEVLQLSKRYDLSITEQDYHEIIRCKTATLIECATQMGAILCERDEAEIKAMALFGRHIGLAFQLIDDALDYDGTPEIIGKNVGDDLADGKLTLPLIYALQQADLEQTLMIREAIWAKKFSNNHFDQICRIIDLTHAIEYTYKVAQRQAELALQYLPKIPNDACHEELISLTDFIVQRDH